MIEKVENPLNLGLEQVESLLDELQKRFDGWHRTPVEYFELTEANIGIDIIIKKTGRQYSYNLEQLKSLKAELMDPVINAVKEFA